jgi:uncharacterized RDD family membrane protein YckC
MRFEIQRADFWKRISAFLFDLIMIGIVIVGVATAMSAIFRYDEHMQAVETIENEYVVKYGINPNLSAEEYEALTDEQKAVYEACEAERQKDPDLIYGYNLLMTTAIAISSVSILLGFVIMELIIPIFFKNGQTLGKKAFGLGVVHTNGVRLKGQAHFIRVIVGKCLIEAMVPVYIVLMIIFGNLGIVGTVVLLLMLILQIFVVASTRTRSAIHDLISDTVVVDLGSQLVFENVDELMAYKTRIHEEEVNNRREY